MHFPIPVMRYLITYSFFTVTWNLWGTKYKDIYTYNKVNIVRSDMDIVKKIVRIGISILKNFNLSFWQI